MDVSARLRRGVWGDGVTTGSQVVHGHRSAADAGRHRFIIPFDARAEVGVRFAAWDSAGNGALVQPVDVVGDVQTSSTSTPARSAFAVAMIFDCRCAGTSS